MRRAAPGEEMQRLRVEKMERQLANLTGLVQKALQVPGAAPAPAARHDYQTYTRPVSQGKSLIKCHSILHSFPVDLYY